MQCIFRFIWAFVPYRLIIVPVQTDPNIWKAFVSRTTLCSAWLSIEHDQKQCQWGIYAGFSPCHWLLLLVVLPISYSGILFSSKRNQWSVDIGNRAQMSRNLQPWTIGDKQRAKKHRPQWSCIYRPKPLILRANAGEWIEVVLHNVWDPARPIPYFDYPRVPLDEPHTPSLPGEAIKAARE